jgi:hypothetical protein
MDGKETSQRSPGLCVGNGKTAPKDARVSELVWSRAGPGFSSAAEKRPVLASWRG